MTELHSGRDRAATWLLVVAAGCALLVLAVHYVFVSTTRGQLVDSAALQGAQIGRQHIIGSVQRVLDVVSVGSLAAAAIAAAVVALLRRRVLLAGVAVSTVVASNVTTQVLKHVLLERPDLGLAIQGVSENTLPSGHTTVAMSVAAAAVLVAPSRLRAVVALVAAAYGAATGVGTLSAGYHRPSDAIAAALVVGAWSAGLAALAVVTAPHHEAPADHPPGAAVGHPYLATLLGGAGGVLLVCGALATYLTALSLPGTLNWAHLLLAYAGGAALIAGTAFGVVAALVVVVHRVAPPVPQRTLIASIAG